MSITEARQLLAHWFLIPKEKVGRKTSLVFIWAPCAGPKCHLVEQT